MNRNRVLFFTTLFLLLWNATITKAQVVIRGSVFEKDQNRIEIPLVGTKIIYS